MKKERRNLKREEGRKGRSLRREKEEGVQRERRRKKFKEREGRGRSLRREKEEEGV